MAISGNLEIVGPGAGELTVSGNHSYRVFEAQGSSIVSISGLTIAAGRAESAAGLLVPETATVELRRVTVSGNEAVSSNTITRAGGILNEGDLVLAESTVTGNTARSLAASGLAEALGGGIVNAKGDLLLDGSTVSGNVAFVSPVKEAGAASGGGILNQAELTVRESTVSGNEALALGGESSFANGGGIFSADPPGHLTSPELTIERSTIAGNSATGTTSLGGGLGDRAETGSAQVAASTIANNAAATGSNVYVLSSSPAVSFTSTIVAGPQGGQSCTGPTASLGYNLDERSSCGFGEPTDQSGVDPLLAAGLAANGGPTETIALLHGSPAIDRGLATVGETTDQRGRTRPFEIPSVPNAAGGDGADVGAFEVEVPRATITGGPGEGATIADAQPSFEFSADEAAAGFVCSLDGAAASACSSPFRAPKLGNGQHTFTVAAIGEAGYTLAPASRTFTVDVRESEHRETSAAAPRTNSCGCRRRPPSGA